MADALDSKSSTGNSVWVQVPPPAGLVSVAFFPSKPYARRMSNLSRIVAVVSIAFVGAVPFVRGAGLATLEGIVKDSNGHALQGAEIRIQGKDVDRIGRVHTDTSGHYAYPALETGQYQVTLLVHGEVKASIKNVMTAIGQRETLNFELQNGSAARPFTKGKHYVWLPADNVTGTHIGIWVEAEEGSSGRPIGMQERMNNQGNAQARTWQKAGEGMSNSH
jgi:hypothetical protein